MSTYEAFEERLKPTGMLPPMFTICAKHGVTLSDVYGVRKIKSIVEARHEIWQWMNAGGKSSSEIAQVFNRDATTVLSALKKDAGAEHESPSVLATPPKPDFGEPKLARNEFFTVCAFQAIMLEKLQKNAYKGSWRSIAIHNLFKLLEAEVAELKAACRVPTTDANHAQYSAAIARECADVANFAMMIADVCGGLG